MDDLTVLNNRIVAYAGGKNVSLEAVLNVLPVCIAKFKPSALQVISALQAIPKQKLENRAEVAAINHEYLAFARLIARDIGRGYFDGLIVLHIDMAQARVLAELSNQQIQELSVRWRGTIFDASAAVTRTLLRMHPAALAQYSVAMLAAAA
ncbi:MAG: hypothetical protein JNM98_15595 [Rhodocyclaceae bacterium]|nr:hypothetical protein [Rhodocyclaceae bacterium]